MNIRNPREYCQAYLKIRDKRQRLVPLLFKPAQENLYRIIKEEHEAGRPVRLIVLKGRQEGISTAVEALMFHDSATRPLVNTLIVAHRDDSTAALFNMNKLFYDCLPKALQPMRKNSNAKELVFENPTRNREAKRKRPGLRSRIRCITAGGRGVGRSLTQNNVHLSEFAFWPGDKLETFLGIMQSVPDDAGTCVIIESTACGFNEFKTLWDTAAAGESGWRAVFLPWYMEPEYRRSVETGTVWSEGERALAAAYGLDDEQLAWRRWCIKVNCGGDEQLFRQEYPNTPDEAFLLSGDPFFDNDVILRRRRSAAAPETGRFVFDEPETEGAAPRAWRFAPEKGGRIRIYEKPQPGRPYVIGADTAGEGSDCFTAHVLDNTTGRQAAELQQRESEIDFARQLYCLGQYYNAALMAVEVNFSTYPELKLEEWHYPNLYQRERYDTFKNRMVKSFGWMTTHQTRPVMLANLHTVMAEAPEAVVSFETLGEMLTFVYGKNRRPEAASGEHDDLVMAAAIAHAVRGQQSYGTAAGPKKAWTAEMREDYHLASPEEKERLRRLWG